MESLFDKELPRFRVIPLKQALEFLLPRHYAGRKPMVVIAFGAFEDGELKAVCTFGIPATGFLCAGICGEEFRSSVIELNRLCADGYSGQLSEFCAFCFRHLAGKTKYEIIVSYSDSGQNHHGYIYRALNFIYTGATKQRTDPVSGDKHSRHQKCEGMPRQIRTSKHRYILFIGKRKKQLRKLLKYEVIPYPKGDNKNYILGEFQKPILL